MARKAKSNGYGHGSITQVKNSRGELVADKWRVCLYFGLDINGKQRKVQRVVHGSKKDAQAICEDLRNQYEGIDLDALDATFEDACSAWETSMRLSGTASPNVLRGYLCNLDHMKKHLGGMPLASIRKHHVEEALSQVQKERGLSSSSLRKVYFVTKRVFSNAVDSDWLIRNPCDKVKAPAQDQVFERKSLTEEECARLHAYLDMAEAELVEEFDAKERRLLEWDRTRSNKKTFGRSRLSLLSQLSCIMAVRIELATGMRRSEVLGLTWDAVDFAASKITVKQRVIEVRKQERTGGESMSVGAPKTKTSTRRIHVEADCMEHLRAWRDFQARALHLVMPGGHALAQDGKTPVCVGDNGSWLRPSRLSVWWGTPQQKGFRDKIGFPTLKMHELRHTQATQLLGLGCDIKTVQSRLGHAKSSITLDLYAHAIPENDEAAGDAMGEIYTKPAQAARVTFLPTKTA